MCLLSLTIISLAILSYTRANRTYNGYSGITRISDYNLLGKVLALNIDVTSASQYPRFLQSVIDYRNSGYETSPYRFMEWIDPEYYTKPELLDQMGSFARKMVFGNLKEYRNCIKHSRPMNNIIKKQGEASLEWIYSILQS